jgi:hypothetical protein
MSIEGLYPSRRQPRSANPLFVRTRRRRQRVALMAVAGALAGFVALDILPVPPRTVLEGRSAAVAAAPTGTPATAPSQRPIRIIPL